MASGVGEAELRAGPHSPHGDFGHLLRPLARPSVGEVRALPRLQHAGPLALPGPELQRQPEPGHHC
eukprot:7827101-Alexandrium_andersonii.AAC.1